MFLFMLQLSARACRESDDYVSPNTFNRPSLKPDDFSDIGRSLTYYLDSFENWNQALVECYELGQKYTTSVLLKKWRKVLNFSE